MKAEFAPELIDQLIEAIDQRQSEQTALKRLELAYREARDIVSVLKAEDVIATVERQFQARSNAKRKKRHFKALVQAHQGLSPQETAELCQPSAASASEEEPR